MRPFRDEREYRDICRKSRVEENIPADTEIEKLD